MPCFGVYSSMEQPLQEHRKLHRIECLFQVVKTHVYLSSFQQIPVYHFLGGKYGICTGYLFLSADWLGCGTPLSMKRGSIRLRIRISKTLEITELTVIPLIYMGIVMPNLESVLNQQWHLIFLPTRQ